MENNKKFEDNGACWVKVDKHNNKYLTLTVKLDGKETRMVAFKNKDKGDNPSRPDFRLYISKPLEDKKPATTTGKAKPAAKPAPAPEASPAEELEL
jgi:uncharacterized protein (DUF736 family)